MLSQSMILGLIIVVGIGYFLYRSFINPQNLKSIQESDGVVGTLRDPQGNTGGFIKIYNNFKTAILLIFHYRSSPGKTVNFVLSPKQSKEVSDEDYNLMEVIRPGFHNDSRTKLGEMKDPSGNIILGKVEGRLNNPQEAFKAAGVMGPGSASFVDVYNTTLMPLEVNNKVIEPNMTLRYKGETSYGLTNGTKFETHDFDDYIMDKPIDSLYYLVFSRVEGTEGAVVESIDMRDEYRDY